MEKTNNFDFLRLLFSSLVIVSHSFPLTGQKEWFEEITNGQIALGSLSVECFFIMSGYLIFISLKNSKSITNYLWKRMIRIFPALFGLVLITGISLSVVTHNWMFMASKNFIHYSVNLLSLYNITYFINNIFESNPYPKAINGSLWSLCYEFTMYLLVGLLFWIRKNKNIAYLLLTIYCIATVLYFTRENFLKNIFLYIKLDTVQLYKLTAFFIAGSLLTYVDIKKYNTLLSRSILSGLLVVSLLLGIFKETSIIILPIFILFVANISTPHLRSVAKKTGDLSYVIYIYGFLIQQLLMHYYDFSALSLALIALPMSAIFAYLSWHIIEKRMMTYKNLL